MKLILTAAFVLVSLSAKADIPYRPTPVDVPKSVQRDVDQGIYEDEKDNDICYLGDEFISHDTYLKCNKELFNSEGSEGGSSSQ